MNEHTPKPLPQSEHGQHPVGAIILSSSLFNLQVSTIQDALGRTIERESKYYSRYGEHMEISVGQILVPQPGVYVRALHVQVLAEGASYPSTNEQVLVNNVEIWDPTKAHVLLGVDGKVNLEDPTVKDGVAAFASKLKETRRRVEVYCEEGVPKGIKILQAVSDETQTGFFVVDSEKVNKEAWFDEAYPQSKPQQPIDLQRYTLENFANLTYEFEISKTSIRSRMADAELVFDEIQQQVQPDALVYPAGGADILWLGMEGVRVMSIFEKKPLFGDSFVSRSLQKALEQQIGKFVALQDLLSQLPLTKVFPEFVGQGIEHAAGDLREGYRSEITRSEDGDIFQTILGNLVIMGVDLFGVSIGKFGEDYRFTFKIDGQEKMLVFRQAMLSVGGESNNTLTKAALTREPDYLAGTFPTSIMVIQQGDSVSETAIHFVRELNPDAVFQDTGRYKVLMPEKYVPRSLSRRKGYSLSPETGLSYSSIWIRSN